MRHTQAWIIVSDLCAKLWLCFWSRPLYTSEIPRPCNWCIRGTFTARRLPERLLWAILLECIRRAKRIIVHRVVVAERSKWLNVCIISINRLQLSVPPHPCGSQPIQSRLESHLIGRLSQVILQDILVAAQKAFSSHPSGSLSSFTLLQGSLTAAA